MGVIRFRDDGFLGWGCVQFGRQVSGISVWEELTASVFKFTLKKEAADSYPANHIASHPIRP
jgi:hypothetical protein